MSRPWSDNARAIDVNRERVAAYLLRVLDAMEALGIAPAAAMDLCDHPGNVTRIAWGCVLGASPALAAAGILNPEGQRHDH
jgi:hypothetical protein